MDVDHAYRRYRKKSDPRALADVFDALGPDLLRLAVSILRDVTDAEDAVQETFLTLMKESERFDAERRVHPWAMGILSNRCREILRRRRRSQATDGIDELSSPGPSPDIASSDNEFRERLQSAIDDIAEPYRTPLRLRLEEGLGASAIADRLRRRASTVRTQLQRGTEQLRKRLPGQVGALVLTVPTTSLERVRQRVLGEATGSGSPPVPTPAPRPALPQLSLAGSLVAVLVLGLWLLSDLFDPSPPPTTVEGAAVQSTEIVTGSDDTERNGLETNERGSVPELPRPGLATIRGRCVSETGRLPLAGASVGILASTSREELARYGARFESVDPVRTDEAGRFEISFRPTVVHDLSLSIEALDHVVEELALRSVAHRFRSRGEWRVWPGLVTDVGVVALAPAQQPDHQIVDASGSPVAGVLCRTTAESNGRRHYAYGRSDKTGQVRFEPPIPQLTTPPEIFDPRFRAVSSAARRTVVVAKTTIKGQLVGTDERPARGVGLQLKDGAGTPIATARTRSDGSFVFPLPESVKYPVSFELQSTRWGRLAGDLQSGRGDFERHLTLVRAAAPTPAHVLRFIGPTGEPPKSIVLDYRGATQRDRPNPRPGVVRLDRNAELDLVRVPPSATAITIDADRSRFLPTILKREQGSFDFPRLDVELQPSNAWSVIVEDRFGAPLPDALVECISSSFGSPPLSGPVFEAGRGPDARQPLLFDMELTDPLGRATVYGPETPQNLFFRVSSRAGVAVVASASTNGATRAVVPDLARLSGRIRGLGGATPLLRAHLASKQLVERVRIEADGEYELRGLVAGRWSLRLVHRIGGVDLIGEVLTELDIREGQSRALDIDGSSCRPGHLSGRVLSAPLLRESTSRLFLETVSERGAAVALPRTITLDLGPTNEFRLEGLPPGDYRLRWMPGPGSSASFLTRSVRIDPGQRTQVEASFDGIATTIDSEDPVVTVTDLATADLQLAQPDGQNRLAVWAPTGTRLSISSAGNGAPRTVRITASGARSERSGR